MKWQNLLFGAFAIVLMAVITLWFVNNFELKTLDQYTGFKGEARHNSLFAARLFSKRMGIPAERRDGLPDMPDTDTVIVLNTERFSLSEEKTNELLGWVEQGGHLITRARVDFETEDEAEEDIDALASTEDRDLLQNALNISIGPHHMPDEDELPVIVQLANADEALNVELDFFNELIVGVDHADEYQLDSATWLIQQPHGDGLVTVVSTLDFIENYSIDQADHAKLFWYLLHRHDPHFNKVWLVHQDTLPGLLVLLYRNAAPLLLVLALTILFIFWNRIPRFGAMIPEPPPQRRRILDHIQASGQFLWKHQNNGQEQLSQAMQHDIQQTLHKQIPGWGLMNREQQFAALHTHLNGSDKTPGLNDLHPLFNSNKLNEQDFVRLVQLARRLRINQ